MNSREEAIVAKEGMEHHKSTDMQIRIRLIISSYFYILKRMISREEAIIAKKGMEHHKSTDMQLRIRLVISFHLYVLERMISREEAIAAKEGMEYHKSTDMQIRVRLVISSHFYVLEKYYRKCDNHVSGKRPGNARNSYRSELSFIFEIRRRRGKPDEQR